MEWKREMENNKIFMQAKKSKTERGKKRTSEKHGKPRKPLQDPYKPPQEK
jgi:hypothetical protein